MKSECNNNKFKEMLFAYELGMLDEKANEEMELHLLECESCNLDVQELIQQSDILRHNPEMRKMVGNLAEEKNNFIKEEIKVSKEPFLNRFWKSYAPTMALVAVILVVLIIKPWDIQIRTNLEAFAARNSIVVLYFENLTGNNEDNQLGKIAANLLITDLAESQYLRVVSGQRLNDLLNHLDTLESQIGFPTQIALETDARWVIKGSILQSEPNIVLTAQLINIETGFVEASHRVEGGEGEDIFTSIDQLTKGIRNDLNLPSIVNEEPDKQVTDITTNSPEAYHHYLEGIRKSSEFYLPEASESFAKALQFDSTFAMVYYYLSLSANRNDRIDFISKAVEYSENASRKEKYFIESREAFINGDIESAVQVLNELLQYYPDEKDAYYFLGRYEKNRGNIGKCITYYNKAIEIDPWYKSAVNELAYTYNEIGSFNEAIQMANKYIEIAPHEPNPYDTKGDIFLRNHKYDSALVYMNKAVEVRPDYYFSWSSIADIHLKKGEYTKAQDAMDQLRGSTLQQHILMNQLGTANIFIYQGKFNKAIKYLDSLIYNFNIDDADANDMFVIEYSHIIKTNIYAEKEQYNLALKELDKFQKIWKIRVPGEIKRMESYRVKLLGLNGEFSKAYEIAEELRELLEKSKIGLHSYWHALGGIFYAQKDFWKAIEYYNMAAEKIGFSSLNMLAKSYLEVGEYEQAISYFDNIYNDFNTYSSSGNIAKAKIYYYNGRACEESNWYQRARCEYQHFIDTWENGDSDIKALNDARRRLQALEEKSK